MSYRNVKTLNIQAIKAIRQKVGIATNKAFDETFAEGVKQDIVKRTRIGSGVDPESKNTVKLKPLKPNYKKVRKKAKNLSSKTRPGKSNLTATGQLLNSITYVKLKVKGARAFLFTIGDRRGRNLNGKSSKIGNKLLAQYLKEGGRHFFDISKSQRNKITRQIKKRLLTFLK